MSDPDRAFIQERRNRLQAALGPRIDQAVEIGGFASRSAMIRKLKITDHHQVHIWARGEAIPHLDSLAELARICGVSLDFLVFGYEETAALADWLRTPTGRDAPEKAKDFLRSMQLRGYRPSVAFYDLAFQAWKLGLVDDLDPRRAALMVIDTHENQAG